MLDANDMELVRRYADSKSEPAFAELVRRHLNLVYSVAMRFVRNPQDAEDIAQAVFVVLEKKAGGLPPGTIVTGWLYETTRWTSMQFLRTQARRQHREQEAYMQSVSDPSHSENTWQQVKPLLETAMSRLSPKDRTLLALRFFENKNGAEVAAALGIGEWAVRKRIERALEKLHHYFVNHGVNSTTAAIADTMARHSVAAAPASLADTVTAVALAKGATASASTLTLSKGAVKFMAWTKLKTTVVIGTAAVLMIGGTTVAVKILNPSVEDVFAHYQNNYYLRRAPAVTLLRPTQYGNEGSWINGINDRLIGRNRSLSWVLAVAYNIGPERMVLPPDLSSRGFDYLLTSGSNPRTALRDALTKQFSITARTETRTNPVLVMQINKPGRLKANFSNKENYVLLGNGRTFAFKHMSLSDIASNLGGYCLGVPIVDDTGLAGLFDVIVPWDNRLSDSDRKDALKQALHDDYGIDLVPEERPIEMLVVEHENGPTDYTPRTGSDLQGYWKGTEQWGGHPWPVVLEITEPVAGEFRAQFRNLWFNNDYAVATAITYDAPKLKVTFTGPTRVFEGERNGQTISGTLKYTDPSFNNQSFSITMTLTDPKAEAALEAQKDFSHMGTGDLGGHWQAIVDNVSMALNIAKLPDGKFSCSLVQPGWKDGVEATAMQLDPANVRLEWGYRRTGAFVGRLENGRLTGTFTPGRKGTPIPITFDRVD